MSVHSNIWKLYVIKALRWFLLIMPIVIIFYLENGLSLFEIMLIQATYSATVALMEIPSGFLADIFGRRKSLIIGAILSFLGFLVISLSFGFWEFITAQLILGIGQSYISGSDSALLYDSLVESKQTDKYTKIEGRTYGIGNFSESIAGILGGLLAGVSLRYPWYAQVVVAAAIIPVSFSLVEPNVTEEKLKRSFQSIIDVVKYSLLENKWLKWLLLLSSFIGIATLSGAWFAQPYFKSIDIPLKWFGFVWAFLNLSAGFSSMNTYRLQDKLSSNSLVFILSAGITLSYLFLSFSNAYFGMFFLFSIFVFRGLATPTINNLINKGTTSEKRATVLSIKSFFMRMGFAITAPIMGWIADNYSLDISFLVLALTIGSCCLFASYSLMKLSKN
jgi:MFS family permease